MHILITGGAGFIGTHLTRRLLARGDTVSILDNLSTGNFDNIREFAGHPLYSFAIDTLDNPLVLDRLASRADAIVHLAAAVGVQLVVERPTETIETNVLGTHAVLNAARRSLSARRASIWRGDAADEWIESLPARAHRSRTRCARIAVSGTRSRLEYASADARAGRES